MSCTNASREKVVKEQCGKARLGDNMQTFYNAKVKQGKKILFNKKQLNINLSKNKNEYL